MIRCGFLALALIGILSGAAPAAPPPSAGPAPYFGTPGTAASPNISYPAPGTYGSLNFRPFTVPPLNGGAVNTYSNVSADEWPGVGPARITVKLPADAKLFVDGKPTRQTGAVREFVTPPVLVAGGTYHYNFRAEWSADGRTVAQDRVAQIRTGSRITVDFTRP